MATIAAVVCLYFVLDGGRFGDNMNKEELSIVQV
jgi:hypothetical protein